MRCLRWALAPVAFGLAAGCGSSAYQPYCEHVASCLVAAGTIPSSDEQTAVDSCVSGADNASNGATPSQSQLQCLDAVSCSIIVTCSTTQDCSALATACP
jgi:hypothetical protein